MAPTLHITRDIFGHEAALGRLLWKGLDFAFTCEDQDRGLDQSMALGDIQALKVSAETAIPTGLYRVETTWSPKYQRNMPLVTNVPGFRGIRIHSGNDDDDTEGCVLPGLTRDEDRMTVGKSRKACAWLYTEIAKMEADGQEVTILIDRDEVAWASRGEAA